MGTSWAPPSPTILMERQTKVLPHGGGVGGMWVVAHPHPRGGGGDHIGRKHPNFLKKQTPPQHTRGCAQVPVVGA